LRIPLTTIMTARLHVPAAMLAAACTSGKAGAGANTAPTPGPYAPTSSEAPAVQPAAPPGGRSVRYGPSAVRYLVHRRLHIQQAFSGQQQAQDLGAQLFVAAAITGPADR